MQPGTTGTNAACHVFIVTQLCHTNDDMAGSYPGLCVAEPDLSATY